MTLTLTTNAEILRWAGAGASPDIIASSALVTSIGENAEFRLCAETRRDWIAGYSDVNTNVKKLLSKAAAIGAALEIANNTSEGYYTNAEQERTLDVLTSEYDKAIKILQTLDANNIRGVND